MGTLDKPIVLLLMPSRVWSAVSFPVDCVGITIGLQLELWLALQRLHNDMGFCLVIVGYLRLGFR